MLAEMMIGIGVLLVVFNAAASHGRPRSIWRAGPLASRRLDPAFRLVAVIVGLGFAAVGLALALR